MTSFNNHKTVINNLHKGYMKSNRLLNFFSIISVVFTCILFTTVFTTLISMNESMLENVFEEVGTRDSGSFENISYEEMETIKNHKDIMSSSYVYSVGDVINEDLNKKFSTSIFYFSKEHFNKSGLNMFSMIEGNLPTKENEIVVSTEILEELNITPKIGELIELEYTFNNETLKKDFTLSGYYKYKKTKDLQVVLVSQAFVNKVNEISELKNFSLFVNFSNNYNLGQKFNNVLFDCGYTYGDGNNITFSMNPAYSGLSRFDIKFIIAMCIIIVLIIISGYLIIYNIFNISVNSNVKFYGLLKNIGFTNKQIKALILKHGLYISMVSIPLGLFLGYISGEIILPIIGRTVDIDLKLKFNSFVFVLSAFFTLFTLFISLQSPIRFSKSISTAEMLKINGATENTNKFKRKKTLNKISLLNLSYIYILRNKKQFFTLVISLSLMPIILSSIYTFVDSFNYNKYINNFVTTDFVSAHYKYFNSKYDNHSTIDDKFIDFINNNDLKDSGTIYFNMVQGREYIGDNFKRVDEEIFTTVYQGKDYDVELYGLDDFPLSKYEVVNGEINKEKLKTGNYIIEILETDDFDNVDFSSKRFSVGDKIKLYYNNNKKKDYTVIAQVKTIDGFGDRRGTLDFIAQLALPSEEYLRLAEKPLKMNYVFDVDSKHLHDVNNNLNDYINNIDNNMNFKSILSYEEDFYKAKLAFNVPGFFLAGIMGLIGVLNFINVMITSIISRKSEFNMLQKIGMTQNQIRNMLILEGILYSSSSSIFFVLFGSIFNIVVVKYIVDRIWFTQYNFNIISLIIIIPIYLICAVVVPVATKKIYTNNN